MSPEDKDKLKEYLINNNITNTREIKKIIEEDYGVVFTKKHVRTLKKQLNIK